MKIRFRAGGFIFFLYIPRFSPQQIFTNIGFILSLYFHLLGLGLFILYTLFWNPEQPKVLPDSEKAILLKLLQEDDLKKARELLDNPKANDQKPPDTKIASDRNATAAKEVPEDLKNSRNVAVVGETSNPQDKPAGPPDEPLTEDDLAKNNRTVTPFLKRNDDRSVFERLTGQPDLVQQGMKGQTYELSTYRWEFAPYMLTWKNRMTDNWYKITSRINFSPFAPIGAIQVYVKVARSGQLVESKIVGYNCDKSFVAPAYASVVNSFPLPPLPDNFPDPFLETTWTINIINN